ncbi:MAG: hypothetical protein Q8N85_05845, partial [Candidatus Omnitrophota bacterium]|nr:hypothetical protein [Candidatus Omnitrophota bacterium]
QKKQTLGDMVAAIRRFHSKNIKIHGMFVLGGDDDNEKTVWDTFRFAVKEKIDTIQMSVLTPFPGTKVHAELQAQKRIFTSDWDLYDGQHVVFRPKLLSARQLQLNVYRAYARFYSLRRFLLLLLKLHFRNAMYRLMGYRILREWLGHNRKMKWLLDAHEMEI